MLTLSKFSASGTTLDFKDYQTTGSIDADSDQLTIASDPGFQIGDPIIIEIGGEAGAGVRGTKGVGGTWPSKSYADLTAMQADTSQANNTNAWREDTGAVYQFTSSNTWTAVDPAAQYYTQKAVPKALCTTIEAIDGLVLTLADAAVVSTTDANVYYDNTPDFNTLAAEGSGTTPTNNTLIIPEGRFAVGKRLLISAHDNWILRGISDDPTDSTIFSPDGTPSAQIKFNICHSSMARDFSLEGNSRWSGFGLAWDTFLTETGSSGDGTYPRGIWWASSRTPYARNLRVTDTFHMAVGFSFCTRPIAANCRGIRTQGLQQYIQWQFNAPDSPDATFRDCIVDSPHLDKGFETFRSPGAKLIRCGGRNCVMSMNSSGRFYFEDIDITIEADTQISSLAFAITEPIVNINSNISPPSSAIAQGGVIRIKSIITEGAINGSGDILSAVVGGDDNPNLTILGPTTGGLGLIQHPDATKNPSTGVIATGKNILVDGIRVIGANSNTTWGNIRGKADPGTYMTARNCVADIINDCIEINNQTNAEYEG